MEKVPTAANILNEDESGLFTKVDIAEAMIKFAKLHVEAALEQVRYNVEINDFDEHGQYSPCVDEPSILNAYPLDNIK